MIGEAPILLLIISISGSFLRLSSESARFLVIRVVPVKANEDADYLAEAKFLGLVLIFFSWIH